MSLQALQNRLAVTGQTLQNIGHNIATTLKGMVVTVGQAFKQLGGIIAQPFVALHRALTSRQVEQQPPPPPRNGLEHQYQNGQQNPFRNSGIDSILEGMSLIEPDLEDFENELPDIPQQPRDTSLDSSEHFVVMENISQKPQNGVLFAGIEDISQMPQNGVLFAGVDNIEQPPQHGLIIENVGARPQQGVLEASPVSSSFSGHLEKLENHQDLKMVSGSQAIKDSGLVESHVEKFKQVAQETKTILMFRPVNPMSTGLLAEGTSAKGLNVHGKSSDWGPMAGYIAFDQALSKKHNDVKAIKKGNEDNVHSVDDHKGKESPIQAKQLSLSSSRLDYLKKEGLIKPSNDKGEALENGSTSDKTQFFINSKGGNDNYLFRLDQGEDGGFKVSYKSLKDPVEGKKIEDWQELKVMGDKATGKPLTADYDMFAMLPKMGDGKLMGNDLQSEVSGTMPQGSKKMQELTTKLGEAKKEFAEAKQSGNPETIKSTRKKVIAFGVQIAVQSRREGSSRFLDVVNEGRSKLLGQEQRRQVDPELGRLTNWQKEMRIKLNQSVKGNGGYTGGDLVKHGTEQDNTQFSEKDDKVFVVMPNGDTFMTQSWEQTQAFMWAAKQDDFLTYTNRSYKTDNEVRPLQTTFYPGQKQEGGAVAKFNNNPLTFDLQTAATNFGLK